MSGRLVLFDFDGTITSRDTLLDFHSFVFGRLRVVRALLYALPHLLCAKVFAGSTQKAKEAFLEQFWRQKPYSVFRSWGDEYATNRLHMIVHPYALESLRSHLRQQHDTVCVVTASVGEWIEPWCVKMGIEHIISSEMEVDCGKLTGKLARANCRGGEKVKRIAELFDLSKWDEIVAYGDSAGDRDMLELADVSYYRWKRID